MAWALGSKGNGFGLLGKAVGKESKRESRGRSEYKAASRVKAGVNLGSEDIARRAEKSRMMGHCMGWEGE